jgi:hypothetical protein
MANSPLNRSYPTCPTCGYKAAERTVFVPVQAMYPPPRQRGRYVRLTNWQCLSVESHNGVRHEEADDTADKGNEA